MKRWSQCKRRMRKNLCSDSTTTMSIVLWAEVPTTAKPVFTQPGVFRSFSEDACDDSLKLTGSLRIEIQPEFAHHQMRFICCAGGETGFQNALRSDRRYKKTKENQNAKPTGAPSLRSALPQCLSWRGHFFIGQRK